MSRLRSSSVLDAVYEYRDLAPHECVGSIEVVSTEAELEACVEDLVSHAVVACDAEGLNMKRSDGLDVLSLATMSKVYLVHVYRLLLDVDVSVLSAQLERVLGDSSSAPWKLMWDCRGDSDSIKHQLHVDLGKVLCCQLLFAALGKRTGSLLKMKGWRDPHRQRSGNGAVFDRLVIKDTEASKAWRVARRAVFSLLGVRLTPKFDHNYDGHLWQESTLSRECQVYASFDLGVIWAVAVALAMTSKSRGGAAEKAWQTATSLTARDASSWRDARKAVKRTSREHRRLPLGI